MQVSAFLTQCRILDDGFYGISDAAPWRLGTVVFALASEGFVMVRKAQVPGENYDFAGMTALPGGMIRRTDLAKGNMTCNLLAETAHNRLASEAGIGRDRVTEPRVAGQIGPIVSSYWAKGSQRFTVIVGQFCELALSSQPLACDRSIAGAAWATGVQNWRELAPANRVVLSHILFERGAEAESRAARTAIEEAHEMCTMWATTIGWPAPALPWDEPSRIAVWQESWPDSGNL